ncbi:acyl-CoA dehydrogenase family protein [Lentisalinibacter orientalis]|uniref:acyl-CoA dehydrogenase family protein n=1 Tax=Lentisalinibacter orientalis TaxID=2992241 RepID=UPI0038684A1B
MDIQLDGASREWQERARRFAEDYLQPHEIEAELNEGRLPPETAARNKARALELGFSAMDVPREYGGLGLPIVTQAAVWEQLGRTTNALSWCFAEPQSWMFEACSEEQIERYILPLMRGERHDCYAITEAGPGSDVAALTATAARDGDDYLLNGEKWYVTSANLADFFWFQGRVDGGEEQALFFVDQDTPGIEMIDCPHFSHTFAAHHPTYRFADVRVPAAARVGRAGDGMTYTRAWFRRERLMIGARCCGAAARLIEEATAFAAGREVGGEPLAEKQAIQALLADSVTELWAARLMTYEAAAAQDRGEDVKTLHARCSLVKLYASEMANRVADRAVQIFGGRGYMRENVAERFFRELRVDRIWEGTSEIQRQIIAGCLLKRGLDGM